MGRAAMVRVLSARPGGKAVTGKALDVVVRQCSLRALEMAWDQMRPSSMHSQSACATSMLSATAFFVF